MEGDLNNLAAGTYQRETISNLYSLTWDYLRNSNLDNSFDISMEETYKILEKYAKTKVTLVILDTDLVDSTKLSMFWKERTYLHW